MMSSKLSLTLADIVNLTRYPIHFENKPSYEGFIRSVREQINSNGLYVLEQFITQRALELTQTECQNLAKLAHPTLRFTNPYKTDDDISLPSDHPIRHFGPRTNAFVSQDKFAPNSLLRSIYHAEPFQQFVADCFQQPTIYEYADPLGSLVLNVLPPGGEHPWHFDENDFSITLVIQTSEQGGIFEIAPNIRTAQTENFEEVSQVLQGKHPRVYRLSLHPASLVLFKGRFSLHRITRVLGNIARYTVIFSYTCEQGIVGRETNNTKIFS